MNYNSRIEEALNNAIQNIAYLSRLADTKLEKKLAIVREQMVIAEANKQPEAFELLRIWERQIIEARIAKYDQHPQLNELSEIEMELAEMEAFEEVVEKRNKILKPKADNTSETKTEDEGSQADESPQKEIEQLKLF